MAVPVFANEGTTTLQTAYKSLAANTEIFAVNDDAGKDYPYYGAKWKPKCSAYSVMRSGMASRVQKAYAFLSMVYPQIKAMVYSDSNFGSASTIYLLGSGGAVNSAYHRAVDNNPVFLRGIGGKASYYTKLSALPSAWEGSMTLTAYTYASEKLTATWYVDGKVMATAWDYPYTYHLNVDGLASGKHTLEVKYSNGAGFQAATTTAMPTEDALYADGIYQTPSIYKIDGSNYFKLCDLAAALDLSVGHDHIVKRIKISGYGGYEG